MAIRLRKGNSYSIIEFLLKYDRSVSYKLDYFGGYFHGGNLDCIPLAEGRYIIMEYVNETMLIVYTKINDEKCLSSIITKVNRREMRQWREIHCPNEFVERNIVTRPGGELFAIDIRNRTPSDIVLEINDEYKDGNLKYSNFTFIYN